MKHPVTVTRTAIHSTDNLGRPYAMLFRHFYDASTGVKRGCKARIVNCKTTEEAIDIAQQHRHFGSAPMTH